MKLPYARVNKPEIGLAPISPVRVSPFGHTPNRNPSVCNLNLLRALVPNTPNTICYSRSRGGPPLSEAKYAQSPPTRGQPTTELKTNAFFYASTGLPGALRCPPTRERQKQANFRYEIEDTGQTEHASSDHRNPNGVSGACCSRSTRSRPRLPAAS